MFTGDMERQRFVEAIHTFKKDFNKAADDSDASDEQIKRIARQ